MGEIVGLQWCRRARVIGLGILMLTVAVRVSAQGAAVVTSLTADHVFPVPSTSGPIVWTANATGGTAPLQYRFWLYSYRTQRWTAETDWSQVNTWSWQPSPAHEGRNVVQVWVRSGNSGFDVSRNSEEFILDPPQGSWILLTREPSDSLNVDLETFMGDAMSTPSFAVTPTYARAQWNTATNMVRLIVRPELHGGLEPRLFDHTKLYNPDSSERLTHTPLMELAAGSSYPIGRCLAADGHYRILEMEYTPDGRLTKLAADVEQHCDYSPGATFAAVRVNSRRPLFNILSFDANAPAIVRPGTWIESRAVASSGTGGVEYKFWLHEPGGGAWTVLRDWGPQGTVAWTATNAGLYHLQVWARTIGRTDSYEDWRMLETTVVPGPPTAYSVGTASVARADQIVTLRAAAGGGSGALEYRFWALNRTTGVWTMLRDYGAEPTFDWNVPMTGAGDYAIQLWVRQAGSTASLDTWVGSNLTILPPLSIVLRGTPGESRLDGSTVRFTWPDTRVVATSENPQTLNQFSYRVEPIRDPSLPGSWTIVAASPADLAPGHYAPARSDYIMPFKLDIQRNGSATCTGTGAFTVHEYAVVSEVPGSLYISIDRLAVDFEQKCDGSSATLYGGIRWNSTIDSLALSAVKVPATVLAGAAATIEAVGSSMVQAVEFRFWAYNHRTGTWAMLRDYATSSAVSWTPASPDSYTIQVWMRTVGSSASYERWLNSVLITAR